MTTDDSPESESASAPTPQVGGPAMDELGLPAAPPSRVPGFLILFGCVVCAAVTTWVAASEFRHSDIPHGVLGVLLVPNFGAPLGAVVMEKHADCLPKAARILLWVALTLSFLNVCALVVEIFPNNMP